VLVRTWNLDLGNTFPPGRKAHLQAMIELITADRPDVVCLQEIPVWALPRIAAWSEMQTLTARASRPKLGPFPIPALLGRALTGPNHGRRKGKRSGNGNAVLIPREAEVRSHKTITLNTNPFCEERGARFGLTSKQMVWWERERRVCQVVQYEMPDRQRYLVANLQATNSADLRLPDAELRRAVNFILRASELEEAMIVLGDFNIPRASSATINELMTAERENRWMTSGPQIDNVLLRRAINVSARVWPDEERRYEGRLLSDHAPIEAQIELRLKT
jgi:endonuclease/exonuclease/phosphatase family metal-dependent hydrolase